MVEINLYFKLVKYWQNVGNRYNALVTIGKSLVEINMWVLWTSKIYKCICERLAVIGNQYFTNCEQYVITLVACIIISWLILYLSVYNQSNSKREFFLTETSKEISCYNVESSEKFYFRSEAMYNFSH